MPPGGQDDAGKLAWLDALRGWAILLVLLTHTGQGEFALRALDSFSPHAPGLVLPTWLANIAGHAGFGVQLFFVVSAFSLTRSTLARAARGEAVGLAFLIRRVSRVGPAFWLAAIGYTAFFGAGPRLFAPHGIDGFDFGLTMALLHVWWPEALNSMVPGGWSIGCEMMFYLLLPVLLGVANRTGRLMALLPAGLVLAQLGWLAANGWSPDFGPVIYLLLPVVLGLAARTGRVAMLLVAPLTLVQLAWWAGASPWAAFDFAAQLPAFCIGILACHAAQAPAFVHIRRLPPCLLAGAGVMVFVVMVAVLPQFGRVAQPIPFVELAALLCLLLSAAPARLLVNRAMVALGRVSYSMYLVHFVLLAPAFAAVSWLVGLPGGAGGDGGFLALYFGLVLIGAFLAASVTFRLVEEPGMALGRGLVRRYRLGAMGVVAAGGLASR